MSAASSSKRRRREDSPPPPPATRSFVPFRRLEALWPGLAVDYPAGDGRFSAREQASVLSALADALEPLATPLPRTEEDTNALVDAVAQAIEDLNRRWPSARDARLVAVIDVFPHGQGVRHTQTAFLGLPQGQNRTLRIGTKDGRVCVTLTQNPRLLVVSTHFL